MQKEHSFNSAFSSDQALILAYLYDELSEERRQAFEARLQADALFNSLYQQQLELNAYMQPGTQPVIDAKRQDAVHWSLQRQLRKQANQQQSFIGALRNLWQVQVSFKAQFASMLGTFMLGLLLAQSSWFAEQPVSPVAEGSLPVSLELLKDDNFQITDLQLKQFDPASSKVQVVYSLESRKHISGDLANHDIQSLLATTMKNDVSDATRLDLIEVLKHYADSSQIREALGYSLLNDPNPGVRMAAAESLSRLSEDQSVRQVLRSALQHDVNPGVRVEAFQALVQHLNDKKTLDVLKNYSIKDSNQFIREQTKQVLGEQLKQKESRI